MPVCSGVGENLPASHDRHSSVPSTACLPAGHARSTLEPLHAVPAKHLVHLVRVRFVPPAVAWPMGHSSHSVARFVLYMLSAAHSWQLPSCDRNLPAKQYAHRVAPFVEVNPGAQAVQSDAPAFAENIPAGHRSAMLVPLHAEPARHAEHLVRVLLVPPAV